MLSPRKSSTQSQMLPVVPFLQCPAKTFTRSDNTTIPGRTVAEHCQIVGEVAREMIQRYPLYLRDTLFPKDAAFAAACHDIGKVSPYFFEKLRSHCNAGTSHLPKISINPQLEREWGGHAGVSQVTAQYLNAPTWVPEILGQHHGFSPAIGGRQPDAEVFGGVSWSDERAALVVELKERLAMNWPHIDSIAQARLVSGLTSVADWIGSGRHFEDPSIPWRPNVKRALDEAGLTPATVNPTYRSERFSASLQTLHSNLRSLCRAYN